jgi:hypothetical protein
MARFSEDDVREIVETLEEQLYSISQLNKIEKMRFKTKIRHQAGYLRTILNPTPKRVFDKMRSKMGEVFRIFPYDFEETFQEYLDEKIRSLK